MTYEEALDYLASLNRFGINLGLARIETLLALMDHPQRRYRTVHVTGTNGKGSTTAMLAAVLTAAGIRTGMYTSPHLTDYTERVLINGGEISRADFAAAVAHTRRFAEEMAAQDEEHPTEFEVLTAAAFYAFAAAGVEYAVVEVGLGGLLDSTNVIVPEVSVITNVSLEHTDRCGDRLEDIAVHKAGIIKPGIPVVTGADAAALDVIAAEARRKEAPLSVLGRDFTCERRENSLAGQTLYWQSSGNRQGPFVLKLLGRHQVDNAALVLAALHILAAREKRITPEALRCGLANAVWPGRFEWFAGSPGCIIDGAHNPAGAKVLRQALDEYFPGKNIHFILGILKDKDRRGIMESLLRQGDQVTVVAPLSERSSDTGELAAMIREYCGIETEEADDLADAFARSSPQAGSDGVLCIAGSLYLAGPARRLFLSSRQNQKNSL